jgi:hypothetical protein
MGVLKLRAVYFDDRARVAKENFRRSFYNAGLARPCGTHEEQIANRSARRVQTRAEHLVEVNQGAHAFFLTYDF